MPYRTRIMGISNRLGLTAYQFCMLEKMGRKYALNKLVKRGNVLYAPYVCDDTNFIVRLAYGPRADLIGPDRMLIMDQRGIKIYSDGFYRAYKNGVRYYADPSGRLVNRNMFGRGL